MNDRDKLKEIIEAIERIANLDFSQGVDVNGTNAELGELAQVINDINDRNKQLHISTDADKQLLISERRFKQLFENATDSIFIIDTLSLEIIDLNRAAAETLGYEKSDVIGEQFAFIEHPDCTTDLDKVGKKLRRKGHVVFEYIQSHKDGSPVPVEISANLVNYGGREVVQCFARNISQRLEAQRTGFRYQSMLLSSQLNPHFIFNSLNSVQFYIINKEVEPALNYISDFSVLMRSVLENSTQELITIEDEISFLTMYLELEKKRFSNKFEYHFNLGDLWPDQYMIPPMLLQPYVENTVVHGLSNKETKGDIWISFEKTSKERIRCIIEDNGVGRDLAMKMKFLRTGSDHRSLGMSITRTRFDLLNSLSDDHYNIKVVDLEDKEGKPLGTKILIDIPIIQD